MSCGAKLPVYVLLSRAFFPNHAMWVLLSLYLLGIGEVLYAAVGCGLRFAEHVQEMCKNRKKRSKKGEQTKNFAEK